MKHESNKIYHMCSTCVVCGECAVSMRAMHSGKCAIGKCGRGCWAACLSRNDLVETKEHAQLYIVQGRWRQFRSGKAIG